MLIDFHTHILPGIDDGSRNVEMSLRMLAAQREQQVDERQIWIRSCIWQRKFITFRESEVLE